MVTLHPESQPLMSTVAMGAEHLCHYISRFSGKKKKIIKKTNQQRRVGLCASTLDALAFLHLHTQSVSAERVVRDAAPVGSGVCSRVQAAL